MLLKKKTVKFSGYYALIYSSVRSHFFFAKISIMLSSTYLISRINLLINQHKNILRNKLQRKKGLDNNITQNSGISFKVFITVKIE